jgi:hypothetical protein
MQHQMVYYESEISQLIMSRAMFGTEQKNYTCPFLPWMSLKATKGFSHEIDCNQMAMGLNVGVSE